MSRWINSEPCPPDSLRRFKRIQTGEFGKEKMQDLQEKMQDAGENASRENAALKFFNENLTQGKILYSGFPNVSYVLRWFLKNGIILTPRAIFFNFITYDS